MADPVIVTTPDADVAELEAEAVSDAADAAVEIARINAARDTDIAETHADAAVAQSEAAAAAVIATAPVPNLEERVNECQRSLETTQTTVQGLETGQRLILERLDLIQNPPPLPPPADAESEQTPDSQEAPPAPAKPKPRFKLI